MRRIEKPTGKMPQQKKWRMQRSHSMFLPIVKKLQMVTNMSLAIQCFKLKYKNSEERHA